MNKKLSLTSKTYIMRPELELTDIVAFIQILLRGGRAFVAAYAMSQRDVPLCD